MVLALLISTTATASTDADFTDLFATAPCFDGWASCTWEGAKLDAEPVSDTTGAAAPADLRIGWFDLQPLPAFDPWVEWAPHVRPDRPETPPSPRVTSTDRAPRAPVAVSHPPIVETPVAVVKPPPFVEPPHVAVVEPSHVAVVEPPQVPVVEPPTPEVDTGARDLEVLALTGKLTEADRAGLETVVRSAAAMTERDDASRMLMVDTWARGDRAAFAKLASRHLREIDQSDPDLVYQYTLLISSDDDRWRDTVHWSGVAMENRHLWTGDTYAKRVGSLYKLRCGSLQRGWTQAELAHAVEPTAETSHTVEARRGDVKVCAREWLEFARLSGAGENAARSLCVSAAGTASYCDL